jgi:hypothetical protein
MINRTDIYAAALGAALLACTWYIGSGLRMQALATRDVARAIDCTSPIAIQGALGADRCKRDANERSGRAFVNELNLED